MSRSHPALKPTARARIVQRCGLVLLATAGIAMFLFVLGTGRDDDGDAAGSGSALENVSERMVTVVPQQKQSAISAAGDASTQSAAAADRKPETLSGEAAKEQLRKSGQYESLGEAFQAARYAAERIDPTGPHSRGAEYFAANPGQQLRAWFGRNGIELASGRAPAKGVAEDGAEPWSVALRLHAAGREGSLDSVSASTSSAEGNRVELSNPVAAITQWFENRKEGVEHGFTLATRPEGDAREVALLLGVEGTLRAETIDEHQTVRFVDAAGKKVLHYTGLKAWDATGRILPSRLELRGESLALLVGDTGAKYPLTIDPLFINFESRLVPTTVLAEDQFGTSVALSGDTALIGAPSGDTPVSENAGCAYVFIRIGISWSHQAKLTASDSATANRFGTSVALSGDSALIGSDGDDMAGGSDAGSAYVFARSGIIWTQQSKLTSNDRAAGDLFGIAVALSGDTALVGARLANTPAGADAGSAYVFVRSGTNWTQQAKLTAADGAKGDWFGGSVALSGDSALIGSYLDDITGSAYVFVRSGIFWTQQSKLTPNDRTEAYQFGIAVALSGDTALIGVDSIDDDFRGYAYVFVRSGTSWLQQAKLTDDGASGSSFGRAVALSGDTALIGAYHHDTIVGEHSGCAYVFVRSGVSWFRETELIASGNPDNVNFGFSVALTEDTALVGALRGTAALFARSGTWWSQEAKFTTDDAPESDAFGDAIALSGDTALIGAYWDDSLVTIDAGSAYVFVRSGTTWRQQAKLTAGDGPVLRGFGYSVAVSADTVLIGAYYDDDPDSEAGTAYVFVRSGTSWTREATLTATDGAAFDAFGIAVALCGDTALIGAHLDDTIAGENVGSAYVFVRSGISWSQQAKLLALDGTAHGNFGLSVALSEDSALIGAADTGSAIVFVRSGTNWTQQAKLTAPDGLAGGFGYSLALIGDTALIGAPFAKTPAGRDSGAAYIYVRSGTNWTHQAKLTATDGSESNLFGYSVALSGDTALIGAPYAKTPTVYTAGAAYVFIRRDTTWSQQVKLTAASASAGNFGGSVALSGDTALIGANNHFVSNASGMWVFLLGQLPEITDQPVSRTVRPGVSVTFNVTATGYAQLRYQWRKNGIELEGENTSTHLILSAREVDAGRYDVIVSDDFGHTATSAAATLVVNSLSNFAQEFPDAAPAAQGFVLVNLGPAELLTAPGIKPAWRFVGEPEWRLSGVPVGGLATGDRQIEFRPVPGYLHPLRESVSVISGAAATVLEREYYDTQGGTTGGLSVTLKPESLADLSLPVAERAQWRLLGQDESQWQNSGATVAGLVPGNYLVECKAISGRATPPPISVAVRETETRVATVTYFLENAPIGTLPGVLPFETVTTSESLPYAFVGQLRSDIGASTGFVVKPRVVATAAHAVFDEGTLAYATGIQWLFQRDRGTYEPKPQSPRGFYIFEGYAAQRAAEGTPGESSPESQNLDVAAMYFLEDAGRGGSSGYLGSNADDNEWLLSPEPKILVGYPVDGVAPELQGRMHATAPSNVRFTRAFGRTFTTADISSDGGTSGGPLCVRYDDGKYYPAAIYLGGSAQTVVRAIDSGVIDLFNRAEVSANGGDNNTGGGIIHVNALPSGNTFAAASLKVNLSPPEAVDGGARWKLGKQGTLRASGTQLDLLSPGNYTIYYTSVTTFKTPAPLMVTLTAGNLTTVTQEYETLPPPTITSERQIRVIRGRPLSYTMEATPQPTQFLASGLEEAGLSLSSASGLLSGTPDINGTYEAIFVAQNESGSSAPFKLKIIVADPGQLVLHADKDQGTVSVQPKRADNIFPQGEEVVLKAKPNAPKFVFAGWEIDGATPSSLTSASTSFLMTETVVATAIFVPNPFLTRSGRYHGLWVGADDVPEGMVTGSITRFGRFALKLQLGASRYTLAGELDGHGNFAGQIVRPGFAPIPVLLQLDLDQAEPQLGGAMSVDGETLSLTASRAPDSSTKPSPAAGRHTLALPADPNWPDPQASPLGHGFWVMKVNASGLARASGRLGDGQPFSIGGVLGTDRRWAVYAQPYRQLGMLAGTLNFGAGAAPAIDQIDGTLRWQNPASLASAYPAGFGLNIAVEGSRYTPPARGVAALDLHDWTLVLGGNGLTESATAIAALDPRNRFLLTGPAANGTSLTLDPATGLLSGRFTPAGSGPVTFKGVLLPAQRAGRGVVLHPVRTGPLTLDPPQGP